MLESLHVKNLALIDECEINFTEGLNILTGETGAGKSILLGSVNLALGQRADKDMIRNGCEEASVELVFSVNDRVRKTLEELELPSDEDVVIILRKITPSKSSFKINGETVLSKQVKELAEVLIDIHGQHEHQSLLNEIRQREMIDAFGSEKIGKLLEEVARAASEYKKTVDELEETKTHSSGREREISLLEYELSEIEKAHLKPGEDEELESEYRRMQSAEKLAESVSEAMQLISGGNSQDAGSLISKAVQCLSRAAKMDEEAARLEAMLKDAENLLGDFAMDASRYSDSLDYDESAFSKTEERLDLINSLKSKFGGTIERVLEYYYEKSLELEKLQNLGEYIEKLEKKCEEAGAAYKKAAGKLTAERTKVAKEFSELLVATLEGLNFLGIQFFVQINTDENIISSKGMDSVEFMISTNPGEPVRPVKNVASGGELSRIMLGIKTILAKKDDIDALIFDEIDSGISGHTAREVAKKLSGLSCEHQVICITHLAEVASMADRHFVIAKAVNNGKTTTSITALDKEEEITELARLLGGDETSEAAMNNARELKNLSIKEKSK